MIGLVMKMVMKMVRRIMKMIRRIMKMVGLVMEMAIVNTAEEKTRRVVPNKPKGLMVDTVAENDAAAATLSHFRPILRYNIIRII
jgi:hypothetical protein